MPVIMHFLDEILLEICVLCFQAGDRRDNINPIFKLYIMEQETLVSPGRRSFLQMNFRAGTQIESMTQI